MLDDINFDSIEPGDYDSKPVARPMMVGLDMGRTSKRSLSSDKDYADESEGFFGPLLGADDDSLSLDMDSLFPTTEKTKPEGIEALEEVLAGAYNAEVMITRVRDLPSTRKEQVREVYFLKENEGKRGVLKVWVFKADPLETARELATYQIIHELGVPTGKPIGYIPLDANEPYPHDVAILGGVIEYAGEYNELIQNLELRPELVFDTAVSIVRMIADYQVMLTKEAERFAELGVGLSQSSPGRELTERMVAGLGISANNAASLIGVCEGLAARQSGRLMVSHGDIHTGNVVTRMEFDQVIHQSMTSVDDFGVIDWGSITLNNPFADVQDFWIHHKRQALSTCGPYGFGFPELARAYHQRMQEHGMHISPAEARNDATIQGVLWHLYEMFDPVRKDSADIEMKAKAHCGSALYGLKMLDDIGLGMEASSLRNELTALLQDIPYLNPILRA